MRMAGRFARRVRASAAAHGFPVIDCRRGERKHQIAEDYLAEHDVEPEVFLILVARAVAAVWEVTRTDTGKMSRTWPRSGPSSTTTRFTSGTPSGDI
jgi:hypothetical protein